MKKFTITITVVNKSFSAVENVPFQHDDDKNEKLSLWAELKPAVCSGLVADKNRGTSRAKLFRVTLHYRAC